MKQKNQKPVYQNASSAKRSGRPSPEGSKKQTEVPSKIESFSADYRGDTSTPLQEETKPGARRPEDVLRGQGEQNRDTYERTRENSDKEKRSAAPDRAGRRPAGEQGRNRNRFSKQGFQGNKITQKGRNTGPRQQTQERENPAPKTAVLPLEEEKQPEPREEFLTKWSRAAEISEDSFGAEGEEQGGFVPSGEIFWEEGLDFAEPPQEKQEIEQTQDDDLEGTAESSLRILPDAEENEEEAVEEEDEGEEGEASRSGGFPAAEALAQGMVRSQRENRPRGRHWYGLFVGSLVLILALVGVGSIAWFAGSAIHSRATDDSHLRAYDAFLTPAVMLDPDPFDSPDQAQNEFVQAASLWKTIMEDNGSRYTQYDDDGRVMIPLGDVAASCTALFGPERNLSPSVPAEETFYTYDEADNSYHVSLFSSDSMLTPYTESLYSEEGKTVLQVGYVSPTDEWKTSSAASENNPEAPTPTKRMEYVMARDESTDKEYIYAIRTLEASK